MDDLVTQLEQQAPTLVRILCHPYGANRLREAFAREDYDGPSLFSAELFTDEAHDRDTLTLEKSDGSFETMRLPKL